MNICQFSSIVIGTAVVTSFCSFPAIAATVVNGSFENGLNGWTVVDEANGSGSWFSTLGGVSPLSGFSIPLPSQGNAFAVTDQNGPGSHVLFQDITLHPTGKQILSFDWFAQDQSFVGPLSNGTESFTGGPNQHFRVDILQAGFNNFFGPTGAGVLANIIGDTASVPPVVGFNTTTFDLTPWAGQTVRLAFREVDNQFFFQAGVDNIIITKEAVPEPNTVLAILGVLGGSGLVFKRKRS